MTDKDGSNRQSDLPTELVARLEVASEGSDELDHAMSMATGILLTGIKENGEWGVKKGRWTQSIDAALALAQRALPREWRGPIDLCIAGSGIAYMNATDACGPLPIKQFGNTPALALCIAVLKARTASAVGTERSGVNQEILEEKPE